MAFVSGLDRLVEAVEAAEAAAAAKTSPRQVPGGFECPHPDCRRVFSKRYNQQAHMRLHDGTRPFSCHLCGKSFRWKSSLKSHAKMHAKISAAEIGPPAQRSAASASAPATPLIVAGVAKRSSKSASPARKKSRIGAKPGNVRVNVVNAVGALPLQLPNMARSLSEKHVSGRKSPDSISMVDDHAAATVLTMLR